MTKTAEEHMREFAETWELPGEMVRRALYQAIREAEKRGMLRAAEIARDYSNENTDPWLWPNAIAEAITKDAAKFEPTDRP